MVIRRILRDAPVLGMHLEFLAQFVYLSISMLKK